MADIAGALTKAQSEALADASLAVQHNNYYAAFQRLRPVVRAGCRDPDILLTYSVASQGLGELAEAERAARDALGQSPNRADAMAQLAILCDQQGRPEEAVGLHEQAAALEPENALIWYNLGIARLSASRPAAAVEALTRSAALDPNNANFWLVLGVAQQASEMLEEAEASFRRAFELDPDAPGVVHSMASNLRLLGRSSEALTLLDGAVGGPRVPAETMTLCGDLLSDVSEHDDAVGAYRAAIRLQPEAIDAHESLARLLQQLGRSSEQLQGYEEALRRAPTVDLYASAIRTAWDLKDGSAAARWTDEAVGRFGNLPGLQMMQALIDDSNGRTSDAATRLDRLAASGFVPANVAAARLRLKLGDLKSAEKHALAATVANPTDQAGWAYLTIIWRLLDDEREKWLADYQRLVMPIDLPPPHGFDSIDAFMAIVADDLHALHVTRDHPIDQSLREGTQTRGRLFDKREGPIGALGQIVRQAISGALSRLPEDRKHPFLGRNTGTAKFQGSWSVRLRRGGFHISHIHSQGWLSSALYVALPDEVSAPKMDGDEAPGALRFGIPEQELGLNLPPRRLETPKVGRLVLFPSYFWHSTAPFQSDDYRLTVAFDAEPA